MDKEFYTFEEVKDELIGKCGTPSRDEYEAEIEAHLIGRITAVLPAAAQPEGQ